MYYLYLSSQVISIFVCQNYISYSLSRQTNLTEPTIIIDEITVIVKNVFVKIVD